MHYPANLAEITDATISEMEQFTRTHLPDYLRNANESSLTESIGQFYAADWTKFKFAVGDKILLKRLASRIKAILEEKGPHYLDGIAQSIQSAKQKNIKQNQSRTHKFIERLTHQANRNHDRRKPGYRFDDDVKMFATYIRILGGPLCYGVLQANLPCALPSLQTTNRYIHKSHFKVNEAVLRSHELLLYLKDRNLPMVVTLSEDATRIVERIQYDRHTNQIIGFTLPLQNGMPVAFSFPARSFSEIAKHFMSGHRTSALMNVIIAQPLANTPGFCLYLFGSDNKYNAQDVSLRWGSFVQHLEELGIVVLAISSDSDPRYNSAMRCNSSLGIRSLTNLQADFSCGRISNIHEPIYIQDTVHIGTKLRNFFLKTQWKHKMLPFGSYFIEIEHLFMLIDQLPKDRHQLTKHDLNPNDKQNFSSVSRMCDQKVIGLLGEHIDNSQGTAVFLQMIRFVLDSFLDIHLMPLQRIEKIWYAVFLLRIWRQRILDSDRLTLKNNFLTNNCFSCIELNAHGLAKILLRLKEMNRPELFLPHLICSQPCESLFRQVRSMTTTHSTVVNFSVKEFLDRVNRIQLQNSITLELSESFVFPRLATNFQKSASIDLPSIYEITITIEHSKKQAFRDAMELGLIQHRVRRPLFPCPIRPLILETVEKQIEKRSNMPTINLSKFRSIALKNYQYRFEKTAVHENSPYVELPHSASKRIVLKKSSLCWLLRDEYIKLSSDRLERVKMKKMPIRTGKSSRRPTLKVYPYKKPTTAFPKKNLLKFVK